MGADRPLVVVSDRDTVADGATLIELNRPEAKNALNLELRAAVRDAVSTAEREGARAIVVAGRGDIFAAGADVSILATATKHDVEELALWEYWKPILDCRVPVIAAIEGYALGGGLELALCCDVIFAAEDAQVGFPEVRLGIMPGNGGTQSLVRLVGQQRAMRLLLSGEVLTGGEAAEMGLVAKSVASGSAKSEALDFAKKLARGAPKAIQAIKTVVQDGASLPLADALKLERKAFAGLFETEDQKEGMAAFLEKRKPRFVGA